ncbi:MAG: acyl-CoA dehydrogenase family protein, partial [Aldersonia sp.]|nr:acyl-CoA dehydrogenase family protein [Aldersonia sp.]
MDRSQTLHSTPEDEQFAKDVREWLAENLTGEFAELRGRGGPGREHEAFSERLAWDRHLAAAGWTCLGWPRKYGGREATMSQQVIFHEEYAKADAPARVSHVGEELLGPTLIAFGTEKQRERFLPGIKTVTELWCQGYSEPGAGSDLAAVSTSARLDGDHWSVNGQKVWTSLAHVADWAFVVTRTEPGSQRHKGLSYLLVPMKQPGVTIRPIVQLTGTSEFNEVFFDDARTDADLVVGEPGDGWRVAMGTLTFERGVSTLGQQIGFA